MEKLSINGLMIIQEKYFQQPQIRLKHTLALAGRSPLDLMKSDGWDEAPSIPQETPLLMSCKLCHEITRPGLT
eukprot:scaffold9204_cov56-Cyclotella_meneghiniana.AAC.1